MFLVFNFLIFFILRRFIAFKKHTNIIIILVFTYYKLCHAVEVVTRLLSDVTILSYENRKMRHFSSKLSLI